MSFKKFKVVHKCVFFSDGSFMSNPGDGFEELDEDPYVLEQDEEIQVQDGDLQVLIKNLQGVERRVLRTTFFFAVGERTIQPIG